MDTPVKNFSSGMISRLAFGIATIGQPDLLIVDEVLSVEIFISRRRVKPESSACCPEEQRFCLCLTASDR